jgi:hypothetical protein
MYEEQLWSFTLPFLQRMPHNGLTPEQLALALERMGGTVRLWGQFTFAVQVAAEDAARASGDYLT